MNSKKENEEKQYTSVCKCHCRCTALLISIHSGGCESRLVSWDLVM